MKIGPITLHRESAIWWVGFIAALVTGLATLDTNTAVAIGVPLLWLPKLRLAAFLVGVGSTWAKTSPFPSKKDVGRVDVSKIER